MTGEMISLARRNAEKAGYDNVKFHLAEIEAMPLADNSVDCVISNCVLNLCADKDAALREIFRVLKPGGRLAVSDIALKRDLPEAIRQEVAAWTGCIAGALTIDDNRARLAAAGFSAVDVIDSHADLNAYREGGHAACCGPNSTADVSGGVAAAEKASSCCGGAKVVEASPCCGGETVDERTGETCCGEDTTEPAFHDTMSQLLDAFDVNEYAASVKIFALKPTA